MCICSCFFNHTKSIFAVITPTLNAGSLVGGLAESLSRLYQLFLILSGLLLTINQKMIPEIVTKFGPPTTV